MAFGVVNDLLNSVSLGMRNQGIEITLIPRSQIEKNPKNKRSINDIEELAQDIRMCGLEQPLVVYQKDDGTYRLLTGERRLTAIDSLIRDEQLPDSFTGGRRDPDIPCIVKDLEEYDLPLTEDLKEKYAIQRTNRFNRKPTDADIMRDYLEWKEIVTELKKNGYKEFVVGTDDDGKEITQSLKGRTREIAQKSMATHVSTGQLAKIDVLQKKGVPELIRAVEEDRIGIAVAETVANMDPKDQIAILQISGEEKLEKKAVNEFLQSKKMKESNHNAHSSDSQQENSDNGREALTETDLDATEEQDDKKISELSLLTKEKKLEIVMSGIKQARQHLEALEKEIKKNPESCALDGIGPQNLTLYHFYEVRVEAYELLMEKLREQ